MVYSAISAQRRYAVSKPCPTHPWRIPVEGEVSRLVVSRLVLITCPFAEAAVPCGRHAQAVYPGDRESPNCWTMLQARIQELHGW